METRAPYALIGLLVLTAISAIFGFVYWLNNTGGLGKRVIVEVRFQNTVSGLLKGAGVLFNGIRVGEVIDLRLNSDNPRQITAMIAVADGVPLRADTHVGLEFQGLTGVPVIALEGRSNMPVSTNSELPVLVADPDVGVSMTQAARDALRQLEGVLAENSEPLHSTIANFNTFSAALARNSDRLDGLLGGLEKLVGGGPENAPPVYYDLTAPHDFPIIKKPPSGQFSIPEPTAALMFVTQRLLVRSNGVVEPSFANARWSDDIPKLFQARILQSFENANRLRFVARATEGLTASRQLLIDIRSFQLSLSPSPVAEVEFTAKVIGDNGRILDAKIFRVAIPSAAADAHSAASALDEAFGKAVVELVVWTSEII
jgi:phospholipid/cholesterol/gamma-HCH transport system substrate-binding protein